MNGGDPYHAYYQHKVKDFREGKGNCTSLLYTRLWCHFNYYICCILCSFLGQEPSPGLSLAVSKLSVSASAQQKQQEILKQVEQPFVPKDPPQDFEFIADPPSISALDL